VLSEVLKQIFHKLAGAIALTKDVPFVLSSTPIPNYNSIQKLFWFPEYRELCSPYFLFLYGGVRNVC